MEGSVVPAPNQQESQETVAQENYNRDIQECTSKIWTSPTVNYYSPPNLDNHKATNRPSLVRTKIINNGLYTIVRYSPSSKTGLWLNGNTW